MESVGQFLMAVVRTELFSLTQDCPSPNLLENPYQMDFPLCATGESSRKYRGGTQENLPIAWASRLKEMPMDHRQLLEKNDPEIFRALKGEENRQREGIELIPSENYTYPEVLALLGSVLTNKYSEGYPGRRYYGGQEFTDQIEETARQLATATAIPGVTTEMLDTGKEMLGTGLDALGVVADAVAVVGTVVEAAVAVVSVVADVVGSIDLGGS